MGPRINLPRYVHAFVDRHGKPRYYVRQRGAKQVPLPGLPYSPEFMAAYSEALAGPRAIEPGAARSKPGTVAAAVAGYFGSATFAAAAKATRGSRRSILEHFRTEHGDKGIATLARAHVERMISARADAPASARNFLAALRGLMQYAVMTGLRGDDLRSASAPQDTSRRDIPPGRKMTLPPSSPGTRRAPRRGWRSRYCFIRRSGGPTSCVWGASMSGTVC